MYELHGFELVVDMWLVLARVVVVVVRVVVSVGFPFFVLAAIHTVWEREGFYFVNFAVYKTHNL